MSQNQLFSSFISSKRLGVVGLSLFVSGVSQAAVIAGYDFGIEDAGTFSATTVDPEVSAAAITKGTGVGNFEPNWTLGYDSDAVLQANPSNKTSSVAAINGDAYFTFTVTPNATQAINLDSLTFNAARGGGGVPRGYDVRSSVDNFENTLGTADLPTARPTWTPVSIDLSGSDFSNLTTATEFRFYIYSPNSGNSIEFDDIELNGIVATVPEPSSALLIAFGGLLLTRRKRS